MQEKTYDIVASDSQKILNSINAIEKNWKNSSKNDFQYTCDDVIEAFIQGKKAAIDEKEKILRNKFFENFSVANETFENLYNLLVVEKKFQEVDLQLKIEGIRSFEALFIVPIEKFISDDFLNIYSLVNATKRRVLLENDIKLNFIFTPNSGKLNIKSLQSDGFALKYDPEKASKKQRKTGARQA